MVGITNGLGKPCHDKDIASFFTLYHVVYATLGFTPKARALYALLELFAIARASTSFSKKNGRVKPARPLFGCCDAATEESAPRWNQRRARN
jgi:hypothetical protein